MRNRRLPVILAAAAMLILAAAAVPTLIEKTTLLPEGLLQPQARAAEPAAPEAFAATDKLSAAFRDSAKRVGPAVVAVTTSGVGKAATGLPDEFLRRFFGDAPGGGRPRQFERHGLGSGVIIDPDGYVLTNNHVVAEAQNITVRLADDREFKAKVVGTDPLTDVALIKIEAAKLPAAQIGDSDQMQVGDWVIAIGAPFGLEQTVTSGIISATGRHNVGIAGYESFLQTDAAINPGNSGGPLVNMRGQVVGINTAIASQSGGYMGVGFAVPGNLARTVMKQIREHGSVTRGWLGVSIQRLTPDMAASMKLKTDQGALISQVIEGGPAEKAGLKAGDVVVEFNGKALKSAFDLQNDVAWTAPGVKVDLAVVRDGKRVELKATIEKRTPQAGEEAEATAASSKLDELGLAVGRITPEATQQFGYKQGQGVLVTRVEPGGIAGQAGLQAGMLILQANGQKVTNVPEFEKALSKADLAKGVPMLVRQGSNQIFVLLKKRG